MLWLVVSHNIVEAFLPKAHLQKSESFIFMIRSLLQRDY